MSALKAIDNGNIKVLCFIYFKQDLDILLPIIAAASKHKAIIVHVCATAKVLKQSPRIKVALQKLGITPKPVYRIGVLLWIQPHLNGIQVLLTAAESTAAPHRWAHWLVKRANFLGIRTYTLQHGFENVGLSDADPAYPMATTRFASQNILIWGQLSQLSESVPLETRAKCISVGCPKLAVISPQKVEIPDRRKYVIAIFENLHWSRYSLQYRQTFLTDLATTAQKFSDTTFIVKPHHDGQWSIKQSHTPLSAYDNVIIANPSDPSWEPFTAPAILQVVDGAITTPSTVAMDAAQLGCPIAVVQYGLDLKTYSPLPMLNTSLDWSTFLETIRQPDRPTAVIEALEKFVQLNLRGGDVIHRIIDQIIAYQP
jgi:hypothetical protein